MRFCVFPKHYIHNFKDPQTFPYEGTPVDASGLTEENFSYNVGFEGNQWDFTRFNPEHFRRIERAILALRDRGIEADLIRRFVLALLHRPVFRLPQPVVEPGQRVRPDARQDLGGLGALRQPSLPAGPL